MSEASPPSGVLRSPRTSVRTAILTTATMAAFAANSLICRLALGEAAIDAAGFTALRLISGALTLSLVMAQRRKKSPLQNRGDWPSAAMLFLYAMGFSFAYVSLTTGAGALILFGGVQVTMIVAGLRSGERPSTLQWSGLAVALGGLFYLTMPGWSAPSASGSVLMATAGMAWGVYSVRGRKAIDPVASTFGNFFRTIPFLLAASFFLWHMTRWSAEGALLAIVSGSLTSGLGYVVWYSALRGLTTTQAAVVQLSVPALAAAGGVVFLSESLSVRLIIAGAAILGGIGLALAVGGRNAGRGVVGDRWS